MEKIIKLFVALVLYVAAFVWLFSLDWRIGLCVFFITTLNWNYPKADKPE